MTHDTEVQVHDPDPPRAKRGGPANSPWRNEKIVARAKELWTDHTATQIASMLVREFKIDVSRNSIIGFLHREKLTAEHKKVVHPKTRGQVRPRVRRATAVNVQSINAAVQKINSAKAAPRIKPEPFVMACVEVEPRNLAFHDLEENDCRFAYGDNPLLRPSEDARLKLLRLASPPLQGWRSAAQGRRLSLRVRQSQGRRVREGGMTFQMGQKVVCIDDTGDKDYRSETFPVKGAVYTIRGCGQYGVHLEEIVNEPQQYLQAFGELFFKSRRFRPLIERKTDIGFAHEILRKATRKRGVNA